MGMGSLSAKILEDMYFFVGLVSIISGCYALYDKKNPKRIGTFSFWGILGVIFIYGSHMDYAITGGLLVVMGLLSATKQVSLGSLFGGNQEEIEENSLKIGGKIIIPALILGGVSVLLSQFTGIPPLVSFGVGVLSSLIVALLITRENPVYIAYDSARLLQQMGTVVILPQLLTAVGALFADAGVDKIISHYISMAVPSDSPFFGVSFYCIGMAVFTVIMGNAFAAFTIITASIGWPFVIMMGGDPVVVGTLGLTAGYCGTLVTPMAANFNIIPANILDIKNKNLVILTQLPFAICMLIVHILLMYWLAF